MRSLALGTLGLAVFGLTACATSSGPAAPAAPGVEKARTAALMAETRPNLARADVSFAPYIDPKPVVKTKGAWLDKIRITFPEPANPIPIHEVIRSLRDQGLNVSSDLPLGNYLYTGYGVTAMPARAALDLILGSLGLDYQVNDKDRYLRIVPTPSKTWVLPVNERKTSYSNSGSTGSGSSGSAGSSADGALAAATVSTVENTSTISTEVNSTSDLWTSLQKSITERLTVLVPVATNADGTMPNERFRTQTIGRATFNVDLGTITVQAPRSVLNEINQTVERIQKILNTRLVFEGRIYLVTATDDETAGIDFSGFRSFAQNEYGLAFSNNALGGVTVNPPTAGAGLSVATGSALTQNALGIVARNNLFQVFNAYLERNGNVQTIQEPFLTTTSGIPAAFSQTDKTYINNISESANQNQVGNQISRENTLVPFEFGTTLRVHPSYDPATKQIRAFISLVQVIESGFVEVDQFVSDGATSRPITTRVPLDRRIDISGEAILEDGAMIILGGQKFRQNQISSSGFKGLKDTVLSPIFGRKESSGIVSTYYLALSVRAVPL